MEVVKVGVWRIVSKLNETFWEIYLSSGEETPWAYIMKECGFDFLENENEITEIATMISQKKALVCSREGCTVIIVAKDSALFDGWANTEGLTEEEKSEALRRMLNLIVFSLFHIYLTRR